MSPDPFIAVLGSRRGEHTDYASACAASVERAQALAVSPADYPLIRDDSLATAFAGADSDQALHAILEYCPAVHDFTLVHVLTTDDDAFTNTCSSREFAVFVPDDPTTGQNNDTTEHFLEKLAGDAAEWLQELHDTLCGQLLAAELSVKELDLAMRREYYTAGAGKPVYLGTRYSFILSAIWTAE